jgi:hypothetical protein
MICYTNETKIGGDPMEQEKLKSLTDLTRRLFLAVYKEHGYRTPFTDLEIEFMELTGVSPTMDTLPEARKAAYIALRDGD